MADVRQLRPAGDDRGQLLLVGALALAVVFIALALLLNTAIYTGNLATRDSGVAAGPAIEYTSAAQRAGVDAVRSVNHRNNTSADDLTRAFGATMTRWDDLAAHHRAVVGDVTDTDVAAVTNGTRIQQDDAARNFTSNTTEANWTVVSGASGVRSIQLTVAESELTETDPDDLLAEEVFHVTVDSDAGTRQVFVYDTVDGPEIRVDDGGTEEFCEAGAVTDGTFVVDVANESVGGAACPELDPVDDTDGSVSIEYDDGGAATGTYTMVVDEPPSALTLPGLTPDGSGSPYWTDAIYDADLTVTYRTGELDYNATVEVRPA